jgi:CRP-like cAMP-binding protein/GNAT superfamily N-acetyltransferase
MTLADMELFADVDAAALAVLEARLERREVGPGETLLREGEPGDCFLLIVDGEATVTRDGAVVGVVGRGSIVGEQALLRDHRRNATVTTNGPVTVLGGGIEEFAALADAPGVRERFGRTAGQRLVASARPVPATLADGTQLQVRPILPADRPRLEEALDKHFSQESHRKRFFSPGKLSPSLINYLVDVDYVDHFAWVVVTEEDGALRGVATTRYIRLHEDPEVAEIAFGVTDDYQGRGLGTFLLGALGAAAPVGGVKRFRASVLAENLPMRAVLDRVGAHWSFEEPGVVAATIDVADVHDLVPAETAAALRQAAHKIVTAASLALA